MKLLEKLRKKLRIRRYATDASSCLDHELSASAGRRILSIEREMRTI